MNAKRKSLSKISRRKKLKTTHQRLDYNVRQTLMLPLITDLDFQILNKSCRPEDRLFIDILNQIYLVSKSFSK